MNIKHSTQYFTQVLNVMNFAPVETYFFAGISLQKEKPFKLRS